MNKEEVQKPWGKYRVVEQKENYWIKKLFIKEGERISLQSHKGRSELWAVLSGVIKARKGDSQKKLEEGQFIEIDKNEKHRIEGVTDAVVLEVSFGDLDEEDIIRFEDDYGRNE